MHHPASRPDSPAGAPPRARLLVVDDEQLLRELYGRVLSLEGYEVETAEDGIEALEWLAKERFDLVVVDRHMPRLDGATMVLALRSAGSDLPVIMISGSLAFTPLPAGVTRELSAALLKPARRTEVISAVATALSPEAPRLIPGRESLHDFRRTNLAAA
ncbi:MAG: response regulator [Chthoniobacter sp.]|nr:response regulator [Chthoniobacter sp.]